MEMRQRRWKMEEAQVQVPCRKCWNYGLRKAISYLISVFQMQWQNHLAELNRVAASHNKRNCACFVPNGVVYTKLKANHPSSKEFHQTRKRFVSQSSYCALHINFPFVLVAGALIIIDTRDQLMRDTLNKFLT